MSTPQIVEEMTNSLRTNKLQLDSVNQQLFHLERQDKLATITEQELNSYPVEKVWRSCGKAFILQEKSEYLNDLHVDEQLLKDQLNNLKIRQNYLETSVQNTVDNLKKALNNK